MERGLCTIVVHHVVIQLLPLAFAFTGVLFRKESVHRGHCGVASHHARSQLALGGVAHLKGRLVPLLVFGLVAIEVNGLIERAIGLDAGASVPSC